MKSLRILFFTVVLCAFQFPATAQEQSHRILAGETLFSIAKKYSVTVDSLQTYNSITDPTKIKVGQNLKIPAPQNASPKQVSAAKSESLTEDYTIQRGDTLYSLARKYDTSVAELRRLNSLSENAVLKVGQTLQVPVQSAVNLPPAVVASVNTPQNTVPSEVPVLLPDPRSYESRKIDSSILWPIPAKELAYATGKTFSVVLQGEKGTEVNAVKSGMVIFSGMYRGFGQVIFIHSQNTGHIYVYCGLETVTVEKEDKVSFNQPIGTLGIDSISGKPQLIFMVFYNGKPVDPALVPRG